MKTRSPAVSNPQLETHNHHLCNHFITPRDERQSAVSCPRRHSLRYAPRLWLAG